MSGGAALTSGISGAVAGQRWGPGVAGRRSGGRPCPEPRGGTGVVGSPPAIGGGAGLWPDPLAGCGDRRIEGLAIGPHPLPRQVASPSMVARIGFSATTSRESRQGRKAAAAASMSGAGARAGASCLHFMERGRESPRPAAGLYGARKEREFQWLVRKEGGDAWAPVRFTHELYRAGA